MHTEFRVYRERLTRLPEPGIMVSMENKRCPICQSIYLPKKPGQKTCCFRCAQTLRSRESASARGDMQRGRGEGKSYIKRGNRHEHRVVMEEKLGRPLRAGEVVHHRDHDRRNNHPDNLILLPSQSSHAATHALSRDTTERSCSVDGCDGAYYSKGHCKKHYQRMRKNGHTEQRGGSGGHG